MHAVAVEALTVLDLSTASLLARVGLDLAAVDAEDWGPCQRVGEAAAHLGRQGILAPSATGTGHVLTVFEHRVGPSQLLVLDSTDLDRS